MKVVKLVKKYYKLVNNQVPKERWIHIAEIQSLRNSLGNGIKFDENEITASVDEKADLRNLIGCIIELLEQGYRYYVDFLFWTEGMDLFPELTKKGYGKNLGWPNLKPT
jgi:hypothetical protein